MVVNKRFIQNQHCLSGSSSPIFVACPNSHNATHSLSRDAGTEGVGGGGTGPPIFGRSVDSIPTGEGRLSTDFLLRNPWIIPTLYYWHPQCFSPSGITAKYFHKMSGSRISGTLMISYANFEGKYISTYVCRCSITSSGS